MAESSEPKSRRPLVEHHPALDLQLGPQMALFPFSSSSGTKNRGQESCVECWKPGPSNTLFRSRNGKPPEKRVYEVALANGLMNCADIIDEDIDAAVANLEAKGKDV